jgi:putative ABC transport system ATP-binding protein
MNVFKQVMLPLAYAGVPKATREKRAMEALKKVGLEDKIHNKPNELSG